MGSPGRKKGRRTRSDRRGGRANLEHGFPAFEHNQYTFEGEIERLGALARGVNRAQGGRRWIGLLVLLLVGLPTFGGLIFVLVDLLI